MRPYSINKKEQSPFYVRKLMKKQQEKNGYVHPTAKDNSDKVIVYEDQVIEKNITKRRKNRLVSALKHAV